ncbi:hypothetical protein JCM6882_002303 [Rhodosporidiobolus microsporus]
MLSRHLMYRLKPLAHPLRLSHAFSSTPLRSLSRPKNQPIKLVEVGPRDGLQNEKALLPTELKVELIERLVGAGMRDVEVGSFVSPKWVPQMASTAEVLTSPTLTSLRQKHGPSLSLPVLVPNARGLSSLLSLQSSYSSSHPSDPPLTGEIAVFVSASESFSKANLNSSIASSLSALEPVFSTAREHNLRVRAYVSVVLGCPFEGRIEPEKPAEVARQLVKMGANEVSLGDTVGVGVPMGWEALVNECEKRGVGVEKLAAHCHDTYGTAIANVLHCVSLGIPTIDSSIAALGGCPYSPGATGNVSTEDVLYALHQSGYSTTFSHPPSPSSSSTPLSGKKGDLSLLPPPGASEADKTPLQRQFEQLCEVGQWVSERLGRENGSRVGRAVRGKREREEKRREKEGQGGKAKL